MTTFGLVHGAYHGSWCWVRLQEELERRGHEVRTVDLPSEDPDAGADAYAAAAITAFAGAPDDLVVVGHSLAGLTIPLVAAQRPVSRMVFLCALLPRPGRSQDDVLRDEPDAVVIGDAGPYTDAEGATRWEPTAAARVFFSGCDPDTAAWAATQLRGQRWTITQEVTPISVWPDVPSTSIVTTGDLVIDPSWSRRIAPEVLGVVPIELDADHSPFLSTPAALADALLVEP
jgi:hypothetical protein